jgi:hypothetical protein
MLPASPPRGPGFARVLGLVPPVLTVPIVVLVLLISLVLGGCSGRGQPAASVVQSALALQNILLEMIICGILECLVLNKKIVLRWQSFIQHILLTQKIAILQLSRHT